MRRCPRSAECVILSRPKSCRLAAPVVLAWLDARPDGSALQARRCAAAAWGVALRAEAAARGGAWRASSGDDMAAVLTRSRGW